MPLLDDRGRLFGRLNIIDAALVGFFLLLLPIGYTASRLFRVPPPVVQTVEPASQRVGPARRIRLTGRNFRPFLTAFVGRAGQPLSLVPEAPLSGPPARLIQGRMMIETSTIVEIQLPDLSAGAYDLFLYDETRQVVRVSRAFTLTAPDPDPEALIHARARFVVAPEARHLLQEGDVEATEPAVQSGAQAVTAVSPATLTRVRLFTDRLPPALDFGGGWGAELIEAEIDFPARQNARGEWEHRDQILRVGERIVFRTSRYKMEGLVGEIRVTSRQSTRENK